MEDKEIRFVHREETFNDLAVRELADGRSACICRLQFGRCTKDECASCEIHKQYSDCYYQMSEYDKQRLAKYVSEKYRHDSLFPEKWMGYKKLVKRVVSYCLFCFVILPIIICVLLYLSNNEPGDIPDKNSREPLNYVLPYRYDTMVVNVLSDVIKEVFDINEDGKINCIDYSIMFKLIWDDEYPDKKHQCYIIRNYNTSTGFHHLYIAIIDDDYNVYFIETYVDNPRYYRTFDSWSQNKIDHNYDIWNETRYWLGKVK